ncbi:bifunctional nicotinamidase/pyrazinamidase [Algibacter amylolyticus]|uniref:Nicotinamidase n=1 Tax=Algibacter amylolyticus TaxID=1608400 RepID=A0A5M7B862_9FLAO|nr:bifunctional nicotinamidase/pyrazinamidase [Algibacter amylolyticus]KAA5824498.1 bifunctional nicotinamidase/pyrazinamidase [Algibacter amylolyticus]MBB5269437.1 nicotinamidase/pyrazinamidase [Algibacter amylolyticus]TSJ75271.1 bifunctional nicotinamidase/pyrazinamidase [Algibacter amylolyticus]
MKTLLVIDVQNDFIPGGSLSVPNGDKIVPVINSIKDTFDLIVATQDWHPKEHSSFAVNHDGKSDFDRIEWRGNMQTLWPEHCVQGSVGAELHPELDTTKYEAIFRKGTDKAIDSYSAFYDNNHLKATGLTGYLKEKGATQLYFCGLASDICVYFSICDAVKEGFDCYFIEDASKPLDVEAFEAIKSKMLAMGVRIITSESLYY